jgi:pimeloyl-ACP methyl ester carboxylesterase
MQLSQTLAHVRARLSQRFPTMRTRLAAFLRDVGRFLRFMLCAPVFALGALVLLHTGCGSLPSAAAAAAHGGGSVTQAGADSPVVVFEAGAGDGKESWDRVAPAVADFTTTFTYSRRGYGLTGPAPWKRDGAGVVEELRHHLATRGLRPPYVLVGHSLGGLYMELFAKLHPDEVAGLVLVDPTHPDHFERMKRERPGSYRVVQVAMTLNAATPMAAELRGMGETSRQWHDAGPPPAVPAIFLTATRARLVDGKALIEFTKALQTELVAQWPGAEQRFVDATHYIQKEKPDIVIAAIREVVDRARVGNSAPQAP